MGVAARSLLVQFLLPLAAAGATVSLRLPIAAKGLLLGAALSPLMGVLLIAGLCGHRSRLSYIRLPPLIHQVRRQLAKIGA